MNIDNMNLKEIKEWVDDEGYLDNVYDPITENTFYWLIARIEKFKKVLKKIADRPCSLTYPPNKTCRLIYSNDPDEWCCVCEAREALEEKR